MYNVSNLIILVSTHLNSNISLGSIKNDILNHLNTCEAYKKLPRDLQEKLVLLAFKKSSKTYFENRLEEQLLIIQSIEFKNLHPADKVVQI